MPDEAALPSIKAGYKHCRLMIGYDRNPQAAYHSSEGFRKATGFRGADERVDWAFVAM